MDYKTKYLKYKTKYLKLLQNGGNIVPTNPPDSSWFIMPFLLAPFTDMVVIFPEKMHKTFEYLNRVLPDLKIGTLTEYIDILTKFYISNGINLDDRRNLLKLPYVNFTDIPKYINLDGKIQLQILIHAGFILQNIEVITSHLVQLNKDEIFIFYIRDYIWQEFPNFRTNITQLVKIHNINKLLYDRSNAQSDDKNKTYRIYFGANVVIREASGSSDVVLISFGHWGDNTFQTFFTLNKSHQGMILYFIDSDNRWYDNKWEVYVNVIRKYADRYNKYAFFGLSMGGYASMLTSLYFPTKSCVNLSLSPQTLNFSNATNLIIDTKQKKNPIINKLDFISINIPKLLEERAGYTTKIYTLVGKSECDETHYIQFDQFHIGSIINYPNVSTIIYDISSHSLGRYLKIDSIIESLTQNFDLLFSSQLEGNRLLYERIIYRSI